MKRLSCFLLTLSVSATAVAASKFSAEAGVSYFSLRSARYEPNPAPLSVQGGRGEFAPFLAAGYSFNERFGLRLSYHFLDDVHATAQFGSPPGNGQVTVPVIVWGHYRDDVHVVGLAPELRWPVAERLAFTFSPGLNWVASRGWASYSTSATIPMPSVRRNDDGITLSGAVGCLWALSDRAALSFTYQYLDLEPSFDREAHVLSGALRWVF